MPGGPPAASFLDLVSGDPGGTRSEKDQTREGWNDIFVDGIFHGSKLNVMEFRGNG